MRVILAATLIPLALAGCVGVRTTDVPVAPSAPQTVMVPAAPPPSVVVCSNGAPAPCP